MILALEHPRTKITSRIFDKIEEISPHAWNRVFPNVLESYDFFKSLDESGFEQFSFHYICVYHGDEMVGAAPFFVMNYPLETTISGPLHSFMLGIKRIFPEVFNLKAVICGMPMDQGRLGIQNCDSMAVLEEVLTGLERFAQSHKAAILAFKDFGLEYKNLLDPIQKQGFYKVQDFPSTDMALDFQSFDEYLKTLSYVSRNGLKRKLKKINAGPQFDLEITHRMSPEVLSEAYALYLQAVQRGETQFETVPMEFFERVSQNMPEETLFFLWRKGKKLVAFAYALAKGSYFLDLYLGFDYSVAFDYHLYFIRFRDLMNWCLQHRMRIYDYGPTGYEAKRRLGFKMIPLYVYAKCRNPWFNPFFGFLCRVLQPENFHKVFRDMRKEAVLCPMEG